MILVAICDDDEGATFQIEELIESTYEKHGVEMEIDVYYNWRESLRKQFLKENV